MQHIAGGSPRGACDTAASVSSPPLAAAPAAASPEHRTGLCYGLAAYGWWGVMPIYFKLLAAVPPLELLAHRVIWAMGLLLLLARQQKALGQVLEALRTPRTLGLLAASTALIAVNWGLYIWAIVTGRILEGSLGYFINPLVNVALGVLVLRETLPRALVVAIGLAGCGVAWLTIAAGRPPWIALSLAFSFALYGLLRKTAPVGAVTGLAVETLLLTPLAVGYALWMHDQGRLVFGAAGTGVTLALVAAGPITAIPLLFFTGAARRLPLSTLGFLQYLAPSLQLLLGVFVYGEPFPLVRAVGFGFIWSGLAVFVVYTLRKTRGRA